MDARIVHGAIPATVEVLEQYAENEIVDRTRIAEQWLRVLIRFHRKAIFTAAVNLLFWRLVVRGKINPNDYPELDTIAQLEVILALSLPIDLVIWIIDRVKKQYKIKLC